MCDVLFSSFDTDEVRTYSLIIKTTDLTP